MSAYDMNRKKVASPRMRERWKREISEMERESHGHMHVPTNKQIREGKPEHHQGYLERFMDPTFTGSDYERQRDINRRKNALRVMSPRDLTRREKQRVDLELKRDKEYLRAHMLSKKQYNMKPNHPDFNKIVTACGRREHSPEFKRTANRYQQNMRTIDPDNPNAGSIEKLRK